MKKKDSLIVVLGILFISFNLRAVITTVGSIVEMIQTDYLLSNAAAGFITAFPLIAFAIVSPFVSKITTKIGHETTMLSGLFFILAGEVIRSYFGIYGLFIGTLVIGVGIAIGNVVVPALIKLYFPHRVGLVTSIYTTGMCLFAAVGAGIAVPMAQGMDFGWKNTLASWFVLTSATVIIWLPQVLKKQAQEKDDDKTPAPVFIDESPSIWKSSLAWWVTIFMGIQSLLFYSLVAWLPTIVIDKGMTASFAGNMGLMFQLVAIPATMIIPTLCDKFKDQRTLVMITCLVYGSGMLLFLIGYSEIILIAAVICMSLGMGGSISLSIAFISLRTSTAHHASQLSGMSQSAGYMFASLGPIATGLLFDIQSSWTMPLMLFCGLIAVLAFAGMFAGSNKTIGEFLHHLPHPEHHEKHGHSQSVAEEAAQ